MSQLNDNNLLIYPDYIFIRMPYITYLPTYIYYNIYLRMGINSGKLQIEHILTHFQTGNFNQIQPIRPNRNRFDEMVR